MEIYALVSQYELIKKSKELIYSSRLLLNKHKKIMPPHPLVEIIEKPQLIVFLPQGPISTVSDQILQSDTLTRLDTTVCLNWKEFSIALLKSPKLILFHIDLVIQHNVSLTEFIGMMETLIKCMPACVDTKLALIVTKTTDISLIKTAKKSSIIGICPAPSNFGIKELDAAVKQLIDLKPYWPEHIISQLVDSKPKLVKPNEFKLTPKQNEVLDLIRSRGASNKTIARIMGISESTVKIHVGAILKEYGLRNRTQLALAAKDSLKA